MRVDSNIKRFLANIILVMSALTTLSAVVGWRLDNWLLHSANTTVTATHPAPAETIDNATSSEPQETTQKASPVSRQQNRQTDQKPQLSTLSSLETEPIPIPEQSSADQILTNSRNVAEPETPKTQPPAAPSNTASQPIASRTNQSPLGLLTQPQSESPSQSVPVNQTNVNIKSEKQTITVTLVFQKPDGEKKWDVDVPKNSTVLDALAITSKRYEFSFVTKQYSYGVFIDELDDLTSDKMAGKYWTYSVNGQFASVGASSYVVKKGDVIVWRYGK